MEIAIGFSLAITGSIVFIYVMIRYLGSKPLFRTRESKFLDEKCPKGEKHQVTYKDWAITYQEITCSKCGKSIQISK